MSEFNTIEEAVAAMKDGQMVVVVDDPNRENEGDLVVAADMITPEKVNFMATEGRGLICTAVDSDIADKLLLAPMVSNNRESHKCNFTISVDAKVGTTTGISASDRAKTIKNLASYDASPEDFVSPGHVFPLRAMKGGVLVRAGHTEASVDLAMMAGLSPAAAICEIAREDGEMMRGKDLIIFAKNWNLKIITIKDLIEYRRRSEKLIKLVAKSELPTAFGTFEMSVYKSTIDGAEHIALRMGEFSAEDEVLLRVHSECITGEVFHSMKCDCKSQLDAAMKLIAEEGRGVIIYMRQEGRGIGLVNKVKAYNLQAQGLDTLEADRELGFSGDLRDYGIGAQIISDLGVRKIKLMTNNPKKIIGLGGYGLEIVERIPLEFSPNESNRSYLKTKKDKMGHLLKHV